MGKYKVLSTELVVSEATNFGSDVVSCGFFPPSGILPGLPHR